MSNELKVGKLIPATENTRDAIHIAIAPVTAGEKLSPGSHVGFRGEDNRVVYKSCLRYIGVIDPFLTKDVEEGQSCWMFIYPNKVTSLRHEWTHPAFDKDVPKEPYEFVPSGLTGGQS